MLLSLSALSTLLVRTAALLLTLVIANVGLVLVALLLAIISIDNLALLLVDHILVVLVKALHMLLDVVSDISHNHVVVDNLLLDSVLTDLDSVAVFDIDIDILAVSIPLNQIIVAESGLDLVLDLLARDVALVATLVIVITIVVIMVIVVVIVLVDLSMLPVR